MLFRSERPQAKITAQAFKLMHQAVAESKDPVPLSRLASLVLSKVEGMDASSWAGFGGFRPFLESRSLAPLEVCWEGGGSVRDPTRHATMDPVRRQNSAAPADIAEAAARIVRAEVENARQPIQCGTIANLIIRSIPQLAADWNGNGTFRKFADTLNVRPAVFNWTASGGLISNPAKAGAEGSTPDDWGQARGLYPLARQIHEVTGMPLLSPIKYRTLLGLIEADVVAHRFHLMETGKRVRDLCKETGCPISRADVNYVLRGLLLCGHSFEDGPNDPTTLAAKLADNVRTLCLREQMVLDAAADTAIGEWISVAAPGT